MILKTGHARRHAAIAVFFLTLLVFSCCQAGHHYGPRRCESLASRYDQVLDTMTVSCETDADRGCYKAMSKKSGCGGIADTTTADALNSLEKDFREAGCSPWPVRCAPVKCGPVCEKGISVNGK